jgi:zinc transport system substrate-binding protein
VLFRSLDLIEIPTEKHGDHYHYGVDPHIWLSPKLVKEFSPRILAALSKLKAENSKHYQNNYEKFISRIDSLDARIKEWSAKAHNKSFLIFHPVLTYYARDYGYEQIPLEVDGKEPGLKHMKKIADMAQQKNIHKILVQKEFDMRNAKVTADQIGGRIIQIDPLSENWPENIIDISKKLTQE